MKFLNSTGLILGLLFFLSPLVQNQSPQWNFNTSGIHKVNVLQQGCNKDTVINFNFDPSSTLSQCSTGMCNYTSSTSTSNNLVFLDATGQQLQYSLKNITVQLRGSTDNYLIRPQEGGYFVFAFNENTMNRDAMVFVPFTQSSASANTSTSIIYDPSSKYADSALMILSNANSTDNLSLSAFNFLNRRDLGRFYTATNLNSNNSLAATYLISNWVYYLPNLSAASTSAYSLGGLNVPNVASSGDNICFGSYSEGIFQTHLRESVPLWAAWLGIFFFWIYNVVTQTSTISCLDKKYENNKWTCWGFYSLHNLGHDEFFTKLSRSTLMLITFSWQGLCCAILYQQIGAQYSNVTILWFGLIACVTSMPFVYVIGYFILKKIYETTLHKFQILKAMKGIFNKKDGLDTYEKQIDDTEQKLYGLYYWFYVFAVACFFAFWTVAVHLMQKTPRQNYYFHWYWLAALAVAFGFEHLFFDPLLTLLFGNFTFYRNRGYYYDFALAQKYKQTEE